MILKQVPPSSEPQEDIRPAQAKHEVWVDGLRGIAAIQVATFHYISPELWFIFESGWVNPDHPGPRILKLIPVRIFANGEAMVRLFFVLSGYCIALGLQNVPGQRASNQYYQRLSSAVFRRTFRLFIPFVVVVSACQVLWFLGAYSGEPPDMKNSCPDARPWAKPWSHIVCLVSYIANALNIFDLQWTFGLHDSLWSIPLELRGSMAVYTTLLALANTRPSWRTAVMAFLLLFNVWYSTKEMTGFFAGLLVAELKQHKAKKTRHGRSSSSGACLSMTAVVIGLYLFSLPPKLWDDPVDRLPPDYHFFQSLYVPNWGSAGDYSWNAYFVGAAMLLAGLQGLPRIREWLSTKLLQYLGHISYAMFLVHYAVKWTTKAPILRIVSIILGVESGRHESDHDFLWIMLVQICAFSTYLGITIVCASVLTIELESLSKKWAAKIEEVIAVQRAPELL